jgi:hypothetical protein
MSRYRIATVGLAGISNTDTFYDWPSAAEVWLEILSSSDAVAWAGWFEDDPAAQAPRMITQHVRPTA